MRQYNILVTGVGAIIGYGIIHSLRASKYDVKIVGMDIYEDAVGQEWCDQFIQAIPAADERYPEFLISCIDKFNIDLVFFGTEQEIKRASDDRERLGEYYKRLVINRPEILKLSEDKWLTLEFLKNHNIDCGIPGSISYDFEAAKEAYGLPLLLKPRRSYASKGIKIVSKGKNLTNGTVNMETSLWFKSWWGMMTTSIPLRCLDLVTAVAFIRLLFCEEN